MAYKLSDYHKCGELWYPVRFLPNGSIEVINEPKNEKEMLDMMIEYDNALVEMWKRRGMI